MVKKKSLHSFISLGVGEVRGSGDRGVNNK